MPLRMKLFLQMPFAFFTVNLRFRRLNDVQEPRTTERHFTSTQQWQIVIGTPVTRINVARNWIADGVSGRKLCTAHPIDAQWLHNGGICQDIDHALQRRKLGNKLGFAGSWREATWKIDLDTIAFRTTDSNPRKFVRHIAIKALITRC